ncbi:uncharacterized protein LOC114755610 [Neltuma alba]|uniref:uncharacterized protein LOC114755610 n=1 Tax=Neltuma alba TaxID=207710 RepID=UPI0010A4A686|nr:uncharacterized protein LOC114755610 [Prosopis alba]
MTHSSGSEKESTSLPESHTTSGMSGGSSAGGATRPLSTVFETSAVLIVPEKLSGENYREWAQSIKLALEGRGKLGHITGDALTPPSTDAKAVKLWKAEDAMVCSWLVNVMAPSLKRCFMFLSPAREMWDAIHEAYGDGENASQIFDLKTKLWDLKQGSLSLGDYYLAKTTLWQELDLISDDSPCCASHAASNKKKVEKERLFELLAGLNPSFDDVRGRILSQDPLPTVRGAFAMLRSEDSRKKVMLKGDPAPRPHTVEPSALAVRSTENRPGNTKPRPQCEHCHKQGHTKDTCWDLHGKPADWKPRKSRGRGYMTEVARGEDAGPSNSGHQEDALSKILERLAALESSQQLRKQPVATVVKRGSVDGDDDWRC